MLLRSASMKLLQSPAGSAAPLENQSFSRYHDPGFQVSERPRVAVFLPHTERTLREQHVRDKGQRYQWRSMVECHSCAWCQTWHTEFSCVPFVCLDEYSA